MCTFGLSGCRVKPRRPHQTGPPGLAHDNPRAQTCTLMGSGASNTTKIPRPETPKQRNGGGRGEKKRQILAPHPSGAPPFAGRTLRGPHPSGLLPSGPHPTVKLAAVWPKSATPIVAKVGQLRLAKVGQSRSNKDGQKVGLAKVGLSPAPTSQARTTKRARLLPRAQGK